MAESEKNYGIPYVPPPAPEPAHQRKISRQKWFEVITVITLIIAGASFLAFRNYAREHWGDPGHSLNAARAALESEGCTPQGERTVWGRKCLTLQEDLDSFFLRAELIGASTDTPLETGVLWLSPRPGAAGFTPEAMQKAVDRVGALGQRLVQGSTETFEKASKTMSAINDTKRPHDKGVAGSESGWKITYVTFRGFDEQVARQPVLFLVVQRLSAASDPALSGFNRALYQAIDDGVEVKGALRAAEAGAGV